MVSIVRQMSAVSSYSPSVSALDPAAFLFSALEASSCDTVTKLHVLRETWKI